MHFDSFDFHASLSANVKAQGYESPTPIQREAIPHVAAGGDVMGLAQTGTGKTAAFLLPIIDRFLKNPRPLRGSARALVIAPTRELAEQIHEAARAFTRGMRFRSVTVYGGVGMSPQTANLRRGADLVVACPGRLLDHVNQGNANLSDVEVLVLDEADHMFDMGFLPDIKKILAKLPEERQTLLFSATMPDSIRGLANETLKNPAVVRIGRDAPAQTIDQCLYPVPQHLKTRLLLTILGTTEDGSVLVFTRTKHRAKRLAEQLCKCGHASACLQGNLSQNQRQKAMEGFRDGRFRIMVATDIAARGIDVSRVAHVVNYDLPDTPETYTHRVGRTGRAEREGQAHSLVTSEDVSMVKAIERLLGKPIERRKVEGFDYATPAPERDREFERPPLPGRRPGQNGRGRSGQVEVRGDSGRSRAEGRPESGQRFQGAKASTGQDAARPAPRGERYGNFGGSSRDGAAGANQGSDRRARSGQSGDRNSRRGERSASVNSLDAQAGGGWNQTSASRQGNERRAGDQNGNRGGFLNGNNQAGKRSGSKGGVQANAGYSKDPGDRYRYDAQWTPDSQSGRPRRGGQGGGFYGRASDGGEVDGNRYPTAKPDVNGNVADSSRGGKNRRPRQDDDQAA